MGKIQKCKQNVRCFHEIFLRFYLKFKYVKNEKTREKSARFYLISKLRNL